MSELEVYNARTSGKDYVLKILVKKRRPLLRHASARVQVRGAARPRLRGVQYQRLASISPSSWFRSQ
mgnify:CR=1 FL=1